MYPYRLRVAGALLAMALATGAVMGMGQGMKYLVDEGLVAGQTSHLDRGVLVLFAFERPRVVDAALLATPDGKLVELIELADHPWLAACQFHPEFQSKPNQPHPLFSGFVKAAVAYREK